jgi:predicted RNA-binding Zn-ribbon protein involved in translation (DUF1610 family)
LEKYYKYEDVLDLFLHDITLAEKTFEGNFRKAVVATSLDNIEKLKRLKPAQVGKIKQGKNISKMHPVDEFICSECGMIMRDFSRIEIDEDRDDEFCYEFEFRYCPRCGAKIVD